jgi:hypothetical protein
MGALLLCGALGWLGTAAQQAQAAPYSLTGKWATQAVAGGEYRVNNNIWGADTPQTVSGDTDSTYFEVTSSGHSQGGVASYPFILRGPHWGGSNTTNSPFPAQINSITSAPFVWNIDTSVARADESVTQSWNAAYESWFSLAGGTAPDAAELMIWMDYENMGSGGSFIETVSIGGYDWDLYHATGWGSWNHYIAYRIQTPIETGTIALDFRDFMDDSLARGWLNSNWYLDNMEAGFEIISGGTGLKSNSFSGDLVIPEPASMALVAMLAGVLLVRRRSRGRA